MDGVLLNYFPYNLLIYLFVHNCYIDTTLIQASEIHIYGTPLFGVSFGVKYTSKVYLYLKSIPSLTIGLLFFIMSFIFL